MRRSGKLIFVALGMVAAMQCMAADIAFTSRSDFTAINLELKRIDDHNPQSIGLNVTLSPDAQSRLEQVTRQEMDQSLRLSINGILVSTTTVRAVLNVPSLSIHVPREIAGNLLPTLLEPLAP